MVGVDARGLNLCQLDVQTSVCYGLTAVLCVVGI